MCDKSLRLIMVFICCVVLFSACNKLVNPYNPESAEKKLVKHLENLETVKQYYIESGYDFLYIDTKKGKAYADFVDIEITDIKVKKAIWFLLASDEFLEVNISGNTIDCILWRGFQTQSCGIAYSINETDPPQISYAIELIPLSRAGWYYYVEDYNEWRVRSTEETGSID